LSTLNKDYDDDAIKSRDQQLVGATLDTNLKM